MGTYPVRTQIYLSEEQYRLLKQRARLLGRSVAELIRTAVAQYLERSASQDVLSPDDPIFDIVGRGESDTSDLSVGHDRYLYGLKR